jgi:hypothetical protein
MIINKANMISFMMMIAAIKSDRYYILDHWDADEDEEEGYWELHLREIGESELPIELDMTGQLEGVKPDEHQKIEEYCVVFPEGTLFVVDGKLFQVTSNAMVEVPAGQGDEVRKDYEFMTD